MYEEAEWLVSFYDENKPDDTIEQRIEPLQEFTSIDFDRSVVTMKGKRPSFDEILSISRKCSEPDIFMTVFSQCVMVQPLLFLKSQFKGYHLCEIPDPLIYTVELAKSCVIVTVDKRMKMFRMEDINNPQMVSIHIQHMNFFINGVPSRTICEFKYFLC